MYGKWTDNIATRGPILVIYDNTFISCSRDASPLPLSASFHRDRSGQGNRRHLLLLAFDHYAFIPHDDGTRRHTSDTHNFYYELKRRLDREALGWGPRRMK